MGLRINISCLIGSCLFQVNFYDSRYCFFQISNFGVERGLVVVKLVERVELKCRFLEPYFPETWSVWDIFGQKIEISKI